MSERPVSDAPAAGRPGLKSKGTGAQAPSAASSGSASDSFAASPSRIADWLKCRTCGRWFHPEAKTCGNYCKEAR